MVWTAIAYNDGKRVKPVWDSKGFRFLTSTTSFSVPETDNPQLIWDMRGIIRNRPDPSLLLENGTDDVDRHAVYTAVLGDHADGHLFLGMVLERDHDDGPDGGRRDGRRQRHRHPGKHLSYAREAT